MGLGAALAGPLGVRPLVDAAAVIFLVAGALAAVALAGRGEGDPRRQEAATPLEPS
jgi:hypothetical protein